MFRNIFVILNTRAGTVLSTGVQTLTEGLRSRLSQASCVENYKVHPTTPQDLDEGIEQAIASGADLVLVAGGDGTVASVAAKLLPTNIALGPLPLGTMNLFAKDLGIPLHWSDAVDSLVQGLPARVDVGDVNGRLFLNRCSIGFYSRVIEKWRHTRGLSRFLRTLQFMQLAARHWFQHRRAFMRCSVGGEMVPHPPAHSIFVVNNPYHDVPGIIPSRPALNTGKLGVYISYHQRFWERFRLYMRALIGHWVQDEQMLCLEDREVRLSTPQRNAYQLVVDGEYIESDGRELCFESKKQALQVARPEVVRPTLRPLSILGQKGEPGTLAASG